MEKKEETNKREWKNFREGVPVEGVKLYQFNRIYIEKTENLFLIELRLIKKFCLSPN